MLCCHKCGASKRPGHTCYTQTGRDAGWRDVPSSMTDYLVGIAERSPLSQLPGWDADTYKTDLQHNTFLGHGQHAVGNVVVECIEEGCFGEGSFGHLLTCAWNDFRSFARRENFQHTEQRFTKHRVGLGTAGSYPEMQNSKA